MKNKSQINRNIDRFYREGGDYSNKGEYQKALMSYNQGLSHQPAHPLLETAKFKTLCALAEQCKISGDTDGAISYYQDANLLLANDAALLATLCALRQQTYLKQSVHRQLPAPWQPLKPLHVENIVMEGGGVKGIAYLGMYVELFSRHVDLRYVKRLGGTSVATMIELLMGVGYHYEELKAIISKMNLTEYLDSEYSEQFLALIHDKEQSQVVVKGIADDLNKLKQFQKSPIKSSAGASGLSRQASHPTVKAIFQTLRYIGNNDLGLFRANKLRENWAEAHLQAKTGICYLTFIELHKLHSENPENYKDLYFTGVNLRTHLVEVFSWETKPHDIISDAMIISIGIPGFLVPSQRYTKNSQGHRVCASEDLYIDGGVLDNYPFWMFNFTRFLPGFDPAASPDCSAHNPYTLGAKLVAQQNGTTGRYEQPATDKPTSLAQLFWHVAMSFYEKQQSDYEKLRLIEQTIEIDNLGVNTIQFDIEDQLKLRLIESGRSAVEQQLPKKRFFFRDQHHQLHRTIQEAVRANDTKSLDNFIKAGADLNKKDSDDQTLLDLAWQQQHIATLVALLYQGAFATQFPTEISCAMDSILDSPIVDRARLSTALEQLQRQSKQDKARQSNN